jgi:hypothetical protein
VAKDKYGIPQPGGNNGVWTAKRWAGINHALTWEETMAILAIGGWPRALWGMAGAVLAAESGRNPFIYNTYKQGHFGLFQISRSAWPEFFAPGGNGMNWVNPALNAQKGYEIYKKQGWGAWEGKTNGGYLAYYPAAMTAAASLGRKLQVHPNDEKAFLQSLVTKKTFGYLLKASGVSAGDIAGVANEGLADAIAGAANATAEGTVAAGGAVANTVSDMFITDLWQTLTNPGVWMRIAYGVTGAALVIGGLMLVVRSSPAMKKIDSTVKAVATRGAAK